MMRTRTVILAVVMFSKSFHGRYESHTTPGHTGRAKYQRCLRFSNLTLISSSLKCSKRLGSHWTQLQLLKDLVLPKTRFDPHLFFWPALENILQACWSIWVPVLPSFSLWREEWGPHPGKGCKRYENGTCIRSHRSSYSDDGLVYIQPTFSDFHSVHWCNWCYKCHSIRVP